MERIWLKQYPAGVPADIDVSLYPSLVELLEESFKTFADRKAFICMDKAITYGELDAMSTALAAYLQGLGLKKGARVAIMMPNVLQNPIASAAILRAGFTVVNVNPLYTPRELEHQLRDSGAEAIIILENFASTLEKVLPKTSIKHVIMGSMGDLLGFKGVIVNFVVRRIKKMVPAFSIPSAVPCNDALAQGRRLPLLKPVMVVNVTISLLGAMNVFDIPYVMTEGGPANSTNVTALYTYLQAFKFNRLGYGSAISYGMFLLITVIALIQLKLMSRNTAEY